jgi:hypothetical protein
MYTLKFIPDLKSRISKCKKQCMAKFFIVSALLINCFNEMYADSKGAGGFASATNEISSYQEPVANLMKAIAAVIVLVGAFNVYFKMQNGDQDVKKTIMLTIGGCVAFIAMSEALPLFFK